jgi:hypothetical protein
MIENYRQKQQSQEYQELRDMLLSEVTQRLGIQSSQEQTNVVVQPANRGVERSLSPVLKRKQDKLSPMSKSFKKTLHVTIYPYEKFIYLFYI